MRPMTHSRVTNLLLNLGHALDHLVLLVYATAVIGIAGEFGLAVAAIRSGWLMQVWGWRTAFIAPGVLSLLAGLAFAVLVPKELAAAAKRQKKLIDVPRAVVLRAFAVMTVVAICSSL